jgi:surface protein
MGILRSIITLAMCVTVAFMPPPIAKQANQDPVSKPQAQVAPATKAATISPQAGCGPDGDTWTSSGSGNLSWQVAPDTDGVCTLTLHSGVSPNWGSTMVAWSNYNGVIQRLVVDGDVTLDNTDTDPMGTGAFKKMTALQTVKITGTLHLKRCAAYTLFFKDTALKEFMPGSLERIETSQATDFEWMFNGCSSLTSINLPKWDTSKVTNMNAMFIGTGLTSLTMPAWDTSKVIHMSWLCSGADNLTYVDLRNLNTRATVIPYNPGIDNHYDHLLPPALQELWLGPNTPLSEKAGDGQAFNNIPPNSRWAEESPIGSGHYIPVPDITARTALTTNPAGHYKYGANNVTVIVNYNSKETVKTTHAGGTPGSQPISWSGHQAEPGKVFDGWDFQTTDPGDITFNPATSIVTWNTTAWDPYVTLTAKWRSVDSPSIDKPEVHAMPGIEAGVDINVNAPASAKPGDTITLTSTPTGGTPTSWTHTLKAGETGYIFIDTPVLLLRNPDDFNARYHLTAHVSATSHFGTIPDASVTGTDSTLDGILPYTTFTYRPGTGTGTPPPDTNVLTDVTGIAWLTAASPSSITRPAHNLFTYWQTGTFTMSVGESTPVPVELGATDADGHTTVTLTAQWTPLAAPTITTATHDSSNTTTLTGTAKPRSNTDTIRICRPDGTDCSDYQPWTGQTGTPFDGNTDHDWTITMPAGTTLKQASAILTTTDAAYPAPGNTVESPASNTEPVSFPWAQSLPLTGGAPRQAALLATAGLLAALLLTTAATHLRNQRRKARHTLR